jgi:hypothetical protein
VIFDLQLHSRQPLATKLLESAVRRGQLANAYLLVGRAVDDKWLLARQLACFLNCQRVFGEDRSPVPHEELPTRRSCLVESPQSPCQNCAWIASDEHPQAFLTLKGDKPGQKTPVEKARALLAELAKTSRYFRVVIIPDADEETFHRPAANALLKSIEEPADNCIFLAFAANLECVLPTIVSRAQAILLSKSAALSLWYPEGTPADLTLTLQAVRAKLVSNSRRAWSASSPHSVLKAVSESSACLSDLSDLAEQGAQPQCLIDLLAESEMEVMRGHALSKRDAADYLQGVLTLSENAKEQIERYVKPSIALESFVFSLNKLRGRYQGESNLAKR